MSFFELVEQLVSISQEAYVWGIINRFPAIEIYPQYRHIRLLGEIIFEREGRNGMQEACAILTKKVGTSVPGNPPGYYVAELAWVGIGGWTL